MKKLDYHTKVCLAIKRRITDREAKIVEGHRKKGHPPSAAIRHIRQGSATIDGLEV